VALLADPDFCDLIHAIGVASLGAPEKDIWHLTKVYWYTVEFGVVRESDGIKAFGAGAQFRFNITRRRLICQVARLHLCALHFISCSLQAFDVGITRHAAF
jgi:hypothetical protein